MFYSLDIAQHTFHQWYCKTETSLKSIWDNHLRVLFSQVISVKPLSHVPLLLSPPKIVSLSLHISPLPYLTSSVSLSPVPWLFPDFSLPRSVYLIPPRRPLSFYHSICCIFHSPPPSCLLPFLLFPLPNCCISYSWNLALLLITAPPPSLSSGTERRTCHENMSSH